MEFSEKWLREWVNLPDISIYSLCDQITKLGIEVEKITNVSSICTDLIVGEIIECSEHDSFIKLLLVKVHVGNNEYINVISRNVNFILGMKVVVATKNSKLFNYEFINFIKWKGIEYNGIICFCEDIGITNFDNDVITLPMYATAGSDVSKYLSLDDNIIKISSTPNRSDALSILGIARDLAAWNNMVLPCLKRYSNLIDSSKKLEISINIPDICFRFFGRIISNINAKKNTPFWMLERLRRSSIESSNIVVNIINYILIELGQPLYIIDLNSISSRIVIRQSCKGESFVDHNNESVFIDDDVIVVSDKKKILALGGHVNSYVSQINENSKDLFLGCGSYNNFDIFNRSFKYGCKNIFTERYDRGIDFSIQYEVMEYATYLILKLCHGEVSDVVTKVINKGMFDRKIIKLYRKKLYNIIGYVISDKSVVFNLEKLGFEIMENDQYWSIISPSWRFDISIEEDIISELLRIIGYNNVVSVPMPMRSNVLHDDKVYTSLNRAKLFLVDRGYHEVITYGFVDPDFQKLLFPNVVPLRLSNPISKEMSSMRVSLWMGLLSSVIYNQNRQENRLRLFESGLCFVQNSTENLGIKQVLCLSGILSGYNNELHWDVLDREVDFYDLKGDVESIMDLLGKLHLVTFKKINASGLHLGQSVSICYKNKMVGTIGTINPSLEKILNLKYKTVIFELIWSDIASSFTYSKVRDISVYPRSTRDISIIVKEAISAGDIIIECKKFSFGKVIAVHLFDIFRGNTIGIGKKSLALRFTFENRERTFTELEISEILKKCIKMLELKFDAVLRHKFVH
ncbi:MAG: phenylalanine--tRNA ligase subunit beta [Buchnera aphidicola (Meitanaphis microgallis)]